MIMTAETDVEGLIRKTQRYEFADGLRDLQLSLLLGLGGVTIWFIFSPWWAMLLGEMILTYGRWAAWIGMLWIAVPAVVVWGMVAVMGYLRRRWLWSETGNVTPARMVVPSGVNLIAAGILLAGIGTGVLLWMRGVVDDGFALRMLWAATGWSFGYTLFGVGREIGLPRYVSIGLIGGIASTLVLFLPLTFGGASLALGLGWCLILGVSGVVTLRRAWAEVGRDAHVRSD
jgi:hypothetical protein